MEYILQIIGHIRNNDADIELVYRCMIFTGAVFCFWTSEAKFVILCLLSANCQTAPFCMSVVANNE